MALARVSASARASAALTSIAIPFSPPPTVGNGVVVHCVTFARWAAPATIADNYGNTYTLARYFDGGALGPDASMIYYCPKITASGAAPTFTITIPIGASGSQGWTAGAVEISGVGSGLAVDQTSAVYSNTAVGQPTTNATPALTSAGDLAVACVSLNGGQAAAITINATGGATWTQDWEQLASTNQAGEGDSGPVSGGVGATVTASWALSNTSNWAALVVVFKPGIAAPTVTTSPATSVMVNAATLNGSANPNGDATTASFDWGLTTAYGNTTAAQAIGAGTSHVPVLAPLTGLAAGTLYHYRIRATNGAGTSLGADQSLTTGTPTPPTSATSAASGITATGATLHASVTPNGFATTVAFDWGLTTAYGNVTADQTIGAGSTPVAVSAVLTGLATNTTYHFRVRSTNAGGTTLGADQSFTTLPPARWRLTIGGIDRTSIVDAHSITLSLNDRNRAQVIVGDFLPDRYLEVVSYAPDGVTPLFGGLILQRTFTGRSQADGSFTASLDCGDWFTYADWSLTTVTYTTDVSLRQVLIDLVADHLGVYGITLDPAQVLGPTLAPFTWTTKRISDALRELSDRTGYVARIRANKQLVMFQPMTVAAPFSITDAATNVHDVSWRDSDRTPYNTVTLVCGPGGLSNVDEEWHYGDGVTRRWPLFAPFHLIVGGLIVGNTATGDDPGGFNVGIFGEDDIPWTVDLATNELVQRADQPIRAVGDYQKIWYIGAFPFTVTKMTGATPRIEYSEKREDVRSIPVAEDIALKMLDSFQAAPKELTLATDVDGLDPGQALTVSLPIMRQISGMFLVTGVGISIVLDTVHGDRFWQYQVAAIESALYQGSYLDDWRKLTGLGSGDPGSIVGGGDGGTGGGGTGGGAMSPIYLGGSRAFSLEPSPAAWLPVPEYVPFVATSAFAGRVRADVYARHAAVGAQVRLFNVTDNVAVALSSVITATVPTSVVFDVAIVSGKTYRLEAIATVSGEGVFAIGTLEV